MKRLTFLVVALVGCAPRVALTPTLTAVQTRREPGLEATPTKLAQRQLPGPLDVDPTTLATPPLDFALRQPEIVTLPNGLTVYLLEDHATSLVSLRALLPVGSVEDPPDKLGLASLTATMVREGGAGALDPAALDRQLEFSAADLGAGASEELSSVGFSLRAAELPKLFSVFADVLQRPRFDEQRLEITRARVLESVRRREDRPDAVVERALYKAVFGPTSWLGREATVATLNAISRADVAAFFAAHWGPKGARLVITGDFERAAVLALVKQHLGGWKGGAPKPRRWEAPAPLVTRVIVIPRKVAQAKVRIGTFGFTRATAKEFPLRLVNTTLGSFGVGRLYREIRDEKGLAYSAYSSVNAGATTGIFIAGFDTRPQQVGDALEAATRILSGVSSSAPPTGGELKTARDMALNAFAFRFDTAAKIASERATFDLVGYPADYLATWRDRLIAVDAAQAASAAQQLGQGLQIVVLGPPDQLGDLSRFGPVSTITDVEQFR